MKKMCLFISFLILIIFTYSLKPVFFDVFSLENVILGEIEYTFYCLDINNDISNCNIIDNGNSFIVKTKANDFKNVKSNLSNVLGESISFNACKSSIDKVVKFYNVKIENIENVGDIVCLYGYTENSLFERSLNIDGKLINIQIAFSNDKMTIGNPIILGDY